MAEIVNENQNETMRDLCSSACIWIIPRYTRLSPTELKEKKTTIGFVEVGSKCFTYMNC